MHERLLQLDDRVLMPRRHPPRDELAPMVGAFQFSVAGVNFDIRSPDLPLLPEPLPCYRFFRGAQDGGADAVGIKLTVRTGRGPDVSGLERLFDGQAWSLHRHGEGFCIAVAPRAPGAAPAWTAALSRDLTEGTVFCDDMLVQERGGTRGIVNPVVHRLDHLLCMYALASREGAIFHGAGAIVGARGCLFAGRSGAGKSTLARQFAAAGAGAGLLSDDRVAVRRRGGRLLAYGTPWAGDAQVASNGGAPLAAVFFLRHGASNRAARIDPRTAFEQMLPVASIPWYDAERMDRITAFCDRLSREVPAYDLDVVPSPDVAGYVGELLSKEAP